MLNKTKLQIPYLLLGSLQPKMSPFGTAVGVLQYTLWSDETGIGTVVSAEKDVAE